jgi:hypothetical protein
VGFLDGLVDREVKLLQLAVVGQFDCGALE